MSHILDVNANDLEPDGSLVHGLFSVSETSVEFNCDKLQSSKYIQLSRSKTIFVDIHGQSNDTVVDRNLECSCDACLKWRSYYSSSKDPDVVGSTNQPSTLPTPEEPRSQSDKIRDMSEVYRLLGNIKSKRRYKNRSGYVLKTGLYKNRKPVGKVSIKR